MLCAKRFQVTDSKQEQSSEGVRPVSVTGYRRSRQSTRRREIVGLSKGLNRSLRPWQADALDAWLANNSRGIVEAATAAGKTMVALAAIDALDPDQLRVVIVVPTVALVEQWIAALRDNLGIQRRQIGVLGANGTCADEDVVIAVVNSARTRLAGLVARWRQKMSQVLLVVDECHRSGSEKNAKRYDVRADTTLGLSATPERSDEGFEEVLEPQLGRVIFRYPLRQALDDGTLAPLRCINLYLDLESGERADYDSLSERIGQLRFVLEARHPILRYVGDCWVRVLQHLAVEDFDAERLLRLIFERRRLVAGARRRSECFKEILDAGIVAGRKAIVFHETIEAAEISAAELQRRGISTYVDHSQLRRLQREHAQTGFRNRRDAVLVDGEDGGRGGRCSPRRSRDHHVGLAQLQAADSAHRPHSEAIRHR